MPPYTITFKNAITSNDVEQYERDDLAAACELARTYWPYNNTRITVDHVVGWTVRRVWTGRTYEWRTTPRREQVDWRRIPVS